MHIYQRLKDMREDRELSQADVAKQLDISQQQYSMYERGEREIPLHHFITLAFFYNVSLDYLVGITDTPKKIR